MGRALEVEGLKIAYGRKEVVHGVSFSVEEGEIFGIVGESGSGKSTIAKTLMGLVEKKSGSITVHSSPFTLHSLQMIFQDAVGSLNPRMTVGQTLREVVGLHSKGVVKFSFKDLKSQISDFKELAADFKELAADCKGKVADCKEQSSTCIKPSNNQTIKQSSSGIKPSNNQAIKQLLSMVGLSEEVLNQYPRELSGGQCQRVSVARALAAQPKILVADEPVSALDVSVQARVLNLFRELREKLGLTIILIAHDLAVVKNVCDRIAVMHDGVFTDYGPAEAVFGAEASDYAKKLLSAVPRVF